MLILLVSLCSPISHLDVNKRNGVNYYRYLPELTNAIVPTNKPNFSENIDTFTYVHPRNNKPASADATIILVGTYLSAAEEKVTFQLFSQPSGASLIFDGKIIIGESTLPSKPCTGQPTNETKVSAEQQLHAHKYHQIAVVHNPGCTTQLRSVKLLAKIGKATEFTDIPKESIYTFANSECVETYYGSTCSFNCSETQCSMNGRCVDGITGTGQCNCLRGYLGANCAEICQPAKHCSGHGRCLGDGTCQCFSGFNGLKCDLKSDINLGSKSVVGIIFYAFCSFGFLVSAITQSCKLEQSNPVAHVCCLVFSVLKLTSSCLIKSSQSTTKVTNMLSLLPIAILAFVLLRGIVLIQNQFKATSPEFSSRLLKWSVICVPIIITIFAIMGPLLFPNQMMWVVGIPFALMAIYTFVFSIVATYVGMKEPFEKMDDLFPNLASELRSSRKFIVCAALFFIFDTLLTWYHVDPPQQLFSIVEYAYYALLAVDVFSLACVGLANDAVLSDIFSVEGDDGGGFVPMGFASITDVDEDEAAVSQLSGNTLFAPLYSTCPSVYKSAEKKFKRKGCCKKCGKITVVVFVTLILLIVGIVIYVNPSLPVWTLTGMSFEGLDIFNGDICLIPNVSIYNPMRIWINVSYVNVSLFYKNQSIGFAEVKYNKIEAHGSCHIYPNVTMKLSGIMGVAGSLIGDIISGDGIMEVIAQGDAWPSAMNMIKIHSLVTCPQSVRVIPDMQIVGGCGRCEYVVGSFALDL